MTDFVDVPIVSDSNTLADAAIARLEAQWPGWTPNDGDLEVVQVEALAPMAQNAAETAATVPREIFRKFGTDLYGTPYQAGFNASSTTTWTLVSNPTGRTIPGGSTQIDIDGFAFQVFADTVVPAGVLSVSGVVVVATTLGAAANGLTGASVSLLSALDWVSGVTVATATTGGADEEGDDGYLDRFARELQLRAKTLVTSRDFEIIALSEPGVARANASNNGSRAVTVTLADVTGLPVSSLAKSDLITTYATYRQVNTIVTIQDPGYTTVNVVYTVKSYPGFDPTDLLTRINAMLGLVLSPAQWGAPQTGDPGTTGWINETIVHLNKIVTLIGDVQGVDYVSALTLNGLAADLLLGGEVDTIGLGSATAGSVVASFSWAGHTYTTASIAWNATLAAVVAAFNAASGSPALPSGAFLGTGGPFPANVALTAQAVLAGPITAQTVTPTGLTGGTATYVRTTQGAASGAVTLTLAGAFTGTVI